MVNRLEEMGALVLIQPAIRIEPPADWGKIDAALGRLDQYDWLVFSSSNGVQYLLDRLEQKHGDLRRLGRVRLAAIGPGTAEELARYRLRADLVPDEYCAEALAEVLAAEPAATRFLLARASRGREVLAEKLAATGHAVDQIVVYTSSERPAGRGGGCRSPGGRPDRLGDGDQLVDRPFVGAAFRGAAGPGETSQHQPDHVGRAAGVGPSAGGRGGPVHDGGPGRGDRGLREEGRCPKGAFRFCSRSVLQLM